MLKKFKHPVQQQRKKGNINVIETEAQSCLKNAENIGQRRGQKSFFNRLIALRPDAHTNKPKQT